MVEFALVVTFLFILFVSMLKMILMMHAYNTLADAAKEGVRYAIVHGTGLGSANCSGPGTTSKITPSFTCSNDATGANVQTWVLNFASVSLQHLTTSEVTVDYDPNSANTNNPAFLAGCSAPGCLVKVTVHHTYTPLFFSWPSITLNAAADGRIMY